MNNNKNENDWKNRIGSDSWKNLLMIESEIAESKIAESKIADKRIKDIYPIKFYQYYIEHNNNNLITKIKKEYRINNSDRINNSAFKKLIDKKYLWVIDLLQECKDNEIEIGERSYLLFQAGRYFWIGPSQKGYGCLYSRWNEIFLEYCNNLNIVILSWEPKHIEGLKELKSIKNRIEITVWTSSWILEEIRRKNNFIIPSAEFDYNSNEKILNEDSELRNCLVSFDRYLNFELTLGTNIYMSYIPNSIPALKIIFACNNQYISIDLFNQLDSSFIKTIEDSVNKAIEIFPDIRKDFLTRYDQLKNAIGDYQSKTTDNQDPPKTTDNQDPPNVIDIPMKRLPKDQFDYVKPKEEILKTNFLKNINVKAEELNDKQKELGKQTAFVLLCGGLGRDRFEKGIIYPSRKIRFTSNNKSIVISILEWRLRQLHMLSDKIGNNVHVFFMVTPETRKEVYYQIKSYELWCNNKSRLKTHILDQPLIPEIIINNGSLDFELHQGGWILHNSGHFAVVEMLQHWLKINSGASSEIDFFFVFNFNNLGDIISYDTLKTIEIFDDLNNNGSKDKSAVDLFITKNPINYRSISRAETSKVNEQSFYLTKAIKEKNDSKCWYSTNNWYLSKKSIENIQINEVNYFFSPINNNENNKRYHLIKMLDQITYYKNVNVAGFCWTESNKMILPPRYLSLKREEDLRTKSQEISEYYETGKNFNITKTENGDYDVIKELNIVETVPVNMTYIWGGYNIALQKRLSNENKIAETWEISTHTSGTSYVCLNLRNSLSLEEFLHLKKIGQHNDNNDPIPFMIKYLDCQNSLSIQCHPDDETAKHLFEKGKYNLQDNRGKEESFFVINPTPNKEFHLYLGFNKESLKPMAGIIRPIILKYAGVNNHEEGLDDFLKKLVEKIIKYLNKTLIEDIKKNEGLFKDNNFNNEWIKLLEDNNKNHEDLKEVFKYHSKPQIHSKSQIQNNELIRFLGKSYLFSAISIIYFIKLATHFFNSNKKEIDQVILQKLYDPQKNTYEELKKSPLLKYFRMQKVSAYQWCRIPPGTIHAWQGGGNLLVEVAQRSDNTFRIIDCGREFTDNPREMHYVEAMYSLTEEGIIDEKTESFLLVDEKTESSTETSPRVRRKHSSYKCELRSVILDQTQTENVIQLDELKCWQAVLNIDGPITMSEIKNKTVKSEITLKRFRAALIAPETTVKVKTVKNSDKILVVSKELEKRNNILCASLGSQKIEFSFLDLEESWNIKWQKFDDFSLNKLTELFTKNISKFLDNYKLEQKNYRLCISWPGYIEKSKMNTSLYNSRIKSLYTGDFIKQIKNEIKNENEITFLNDAFVSALGEHEHILGRLSGYESGMVLNIGSGFCVGFFPDADGLAEKFEIKEQKDRVKLYNLVGAIGAVGRWLFINPKTGKFSKFKSNSVESEKTLQDTLINFVYEKDVSKKVGEYRRISYYLSNESIIARFILICKNNGHKIDSFNDFIQNINQKDDYILNICENFKTYFKEKTIHSYIYSINENKIDGEITKKYITLIAYNIASIIKEVTNMIENIVDEIDENNNIGKAIKYLLKCRERIVLTGTIGEHFGIIKDSSDNDNDYLVKKIKTFLKEIYSGYQTEHGFVERSEIVISSKRELQGFIHYLKYSNHI